MTIKDLVKEVEMFDELSMDELQASILEIKKKQRERKFKECKRRVLEKIKKH